MILQIRYIFTNKVRVQSLYYNFRVKLWLFSSIVFTVSAFDRGLAAIDRGWGRRCLLARKTLVYDFLAELLEPGLELGLVSGVVTWCMTSNFSQIFVRHDGKAGVSFLPVITKTK
jgi:hypothetical protein